MLTRNDLIDIIVQGFGALSKGSPPATHLPMPAGTAPLPGGPPPAPAAPPPQGSPPAQGDAQSAAQAASNDGPRGRVFLSEYDIKKRLTPQSDELEIPKDAILSPLAVDWIILRGIRVIRE